MSNVTSTGDLSGLLGISNGVFDDAMFDAADFFANHFYDVIYDVFTGNGFVYSSSNTYLSAHLYGANGDAEFYGSGFFNTSGKITRIDFAGEGGTFSVQGKANWNSAKLTLTGSFTSIETHLGDSGLLIEGRLNFDKNGNLAGSVSRQVVFADDLTVEYIGRMSATSLSGSLSKIILHDDSGNSVTVTGRYSVPAYQAVLDASATVNDVLNTASLFSGNDTFTVLDASRIWHGFGGNDILTGGNLDDTFFGDDGKDTLFGMGGSDFLDGGDGDDILDGGAGDDIMVGGDGKDKYFVDSSDDVVVENASEGVDTVVSSASFNLQTNGEHVEILTLTGTDNIDATGNDLDNTITGNKGDNRIDGGLGADKMSGDTGNDTYIVDNVGDKITDKSGIDTVESSISYVLGRSLENLTLTGSDNINGTGTKSANILHGNSGDNSLNGDRGDDTLEGHEGHDFLTGGMGADLFVYSAASFDGLDDTIADFFVDQGDRVDIHDLLSGFDPLTSLLADFVQISVSGNDSVLSVDVDGSALGFTWVQVATLSNASGLPDAETLVANGNLIVA